MDPRIAASRARSARGLADAMMWREGETNRLRGGLYDAMVGAVPPQTARSLAGLLDFVPGLGDAAGFEDAYQAGKAGDYGTAALLGAAGLVGLAPGVGDAAASGMRSLADDVADLLRAGRASEVTDDMLAAFTPNDHARMAELYESGATGMDLPMDIDNRMYRADEMGYPVHKMFGGKYYHQTPADIPAFKLNANPESHTGGGGIWLADTPQDIPAAHNTTQRIDGERQFREGVNIMPVFNKVDAPLPGATRYEMRMNNELPDNFPLYVDMETNQNLREKGFTHVDQGIERVVFDPKNIRSRFARFDPRLAHLSNLNAGLAGLMAMGGLGALYQPQEPEQY